MLLEANNRRPENDSGLGLQVRLDVKKFPPTLQLQDGQMIRVHDVIHWLSLPRRCPDFSTCVSCFFGGNLPPFAAAVRVAVFPANLGPQPSNFSENLIV